MKRIVLAILALAALTAPAYAQNAAQIGRAQSGASCPKCNLFQADFNGRELRNKNFAGARLRQRARHQPDLESLPAGRAGAAEAIKGVRAIFP